MKAIYETKGRAREYNELACNLYAGCSHGCVYCYGADVTHKTKDVFFNNISPRPNILKALERDAAIYAKKGETRPVLLCFITDPYQPIEEIHHISDQAIDILHDAGLKVVILTKGGLRASSGIRKLREGDAFATTLTFETIGDSTLWESGAALPSARIASLKLAKEKGIETWVSCEPVIYPGATLRLIEESAPYVDHYKIGKMNYAGKLPAEFKKLLPMVDWGKFADDVMALCDNLGKPYYLKQDLRDYMI